MAKGSDADITSFVKVWGILPGALLLTFVFTRLRSNFSREKVLYIIIGGFLLFFVLFTFFIFPNQSSLHPHQTAAYLKEALPPYLAGVARIITMLEYWSYSLFYVMAELWGSIGLTVLFWGFANETSKVTEAKRFYGPLGLGTNFSGVVGGALTAYFCQKHLNPYLPYGQNPWEQSLISCTLIVLFSGVCTLFLYRWMHKNVLTDPRFEVEADRQPFQKKRLSLRESFKHVLQSKYLLFLSIMVLGLNIENHLIEVLWKSQVKALSSEKVEFARYMSYTQIFIGGSAMLSSLFLTGNVIRKFGWTISALVPPIMAMIVGVIFFSFYFLKPAMEMSNYVFWGLSPLAFVALLGTVHNVVTRAFRYSLFDATKELAFTPLSKDSKVKGKAAIDGVGSRFGKSAGAGMIQGMMFFFSSLAGAAPMMAVLVFFVTACWTGSVLFLGKRFDALTKKKDSSLSNDTQSEESPLHEKDKQAIGSGV